MVIARLDRATQYSRDFSAENANPSSSPSDLRIKIDPVRIVFFYQRNLPRPRPFLQPLLTMDGSFDVFEAFEIDQPVHVIFLGEAFGGARFVLVRPANEVVGYADVKRAADATDKDVDVEGAGSHPPSLGYWVARSSRAMTVSFCAEKIAAVGVMPRHCATHPLAVLLQFIKPVGSLSSSTILRFSRVLPNCDGLA